MTNAKLSETVCICDPKDGFRRCFASGVLVLTSSVEGIPADQRRSLLQKFATSIRLLAITTFTANITSAPPFRKASASSGRSTSERTTFKAIPTGNTSKF